MNSLMAKCRCSSRKTTQLVREYAVVQFLSGMPVMTSSEFSQFARITLFRNTKQINDREAELVDGTNTLTKAKVSVCWSLRGQHFAVGLQIIENEIAAAILMRESSMNLVLLLRPANSFGHGMEFISAR